MGNTHERERLLKCVLVHHASVAHLALEAYVFCRYYWTLSGLIREFNHLYLLLREPFSKTIVNAYREFTDNLHISELKQMRVKTAAKFRERNKYKPYVRQRISELIL